MMDLLIPAFVFSVLCLDHSAVGPFMLSRPLVMGSVLGFLGGNAALGFFVGVVVELIWIRIVSAGIPPINVSLVAGLATVWSLCSVHPGRASVVAGLLLAVPCGMCMKPVDVWLCHQNSRFLPWVVKGVEKGSESGLLKAMCVFLSVWVLKSFIVFLFFGVSGQWVIDFLLRCCPLRLLEAFDFTGKFLPVIGFCAALSYFVDRSKKNFPWFGKL